MNGGVDVREGDLYRVINIDGVIFTIYYGYYEEIDRFGKYNEPIPIYPNFNENPQYNMRGEPFVTHMQDICEHYDGVLNGDSCNTCKHYEKREDLLGICLCEKNRKRE